MRKLLLVLASVLAGTAAFAQSMTGTITGLPGTSGTYTFSGTLTAPAVCSITAPNSGTITDSAGNTFTWGTFYSSAYGYNVVLNGANNGIGTLLQRFNGTVFIKNGAGTWYSWSGSWQAATAPGGCN